VSKLKTFGWFLLGVAMVGMSCFCTTFPNVVGVSVGWIGVVFFGLCLAGILAQLFSTGPQVVIDSEGITSRRWKCGTMRWDDIESLWVTSIRSSKFLSLRLKTPSAYLEKLPFHQRALAKMNVAFGFEVVNIGFQGMTPGLKEAWKHIVANRPEKVAPGVVSF